MKKALSRLAPEAEVRTSMSPRIFKKEASANIEVIPFRHDESGKSAREIRGLKPLVLPDISGLGALPSGSSGVQRNSSTGDALVDVRRQAAEILSNAEIRAKELQESALNDAMTDFNEKLEAAVKTELEELREQFAGSLDAIAELGNDLPGRIERELVGLTMAVAKKIIGREISTDRAIVIDLLNAALARLQERSLAEVHLNPDDLSYIEEHRSDVTFRGTLDLIADPSISVGGCLIHTETGDIDGRINSQLDELSHGLLDA